MRTMRWTATVGLLAAALAGCSADPGLIPPTATVAPAAASTTVSAATTPAIVSQLASAAAQQASLPTCASLFRPGVKVSAGPPWQCKDPDGGIYPMPTFRCNDGTHLASIEPRSGAPRGWFIAGQAFHAVTGDIAADKGYSDAYQKCFA